MSDPETTNGGWIYGFTDIPVGMSAREWFEAVKPRKRHFTPRALLRYVRTAVRRHFERRALLRYAGTAVRR